MRLIESANSIIQTMIMFLTVIITWRIYTRKQKDGRWSDGYISTTYDLANAIWNR